MLNEYINHLGYSYWHDVFEDIRTEWKKHIDIEFVLKEEKVFLNDKEGRLSFSPQEKWETEIGGRYIDLCFMYAPTGTKVLNKPDLIGKNAKLDLLDENTIGGLVYLVRELAFSSAIETMLRSYTRSRIKVAKPLEKKTVDNLLFEIVQINKMVAYEIKRASAVRRNHVIEISCKTILLMEELDQELQKDLVQKGTYPIGDISPGYYKNIETLVKTTRNETISDIKYRISNLYYTIEEIWKEEQHDHPGSGIDGYPATLSETICNRIEEIHQSIVELEEHIENIKSSKKIAKKQEEHRKKQIKELMEKPRGSR